MKLPSRDDIQRIRERYAAGSRVELIRMNDPYNRSLKPGCEGTVVDVDDMGTVFVKWDCGRGLGVVLGEDEIRVLDKAGEQSD